MLIPFKWHFYDVTLADFKALEAKSHKFHVTKDANGNVSSFSVSGVVMLMDGYNYYASVFADDWDTFCYQIAYHTHEGRVSPVDLTIDCFNHELRTRFVKEVLKDPKWVDVDSLLFELKKGELKDLHTLLPSLKASL